MDIVVCIVLLGVWLQTPASFGQTDGSAGPPVLDGESSWSSALGALRLGAPARPAAAGAGGRLSSGEYGTMPASADDPGSVAPPGAEKNTHSWDLLLDTRFIFLSGFVSAREHTVEGNRLSFHDLNDDFGENIGLGVKWSINPKNELELRIAYFLLRGSTTLDSDQVFNNTTIQGGTTITSKPSWLEFRLTYLRELFAVPSIRSSLWFLFGVDFHWVDWRFGATLSPTTHSHEPGEDFYLQTFPLPVFGLRYLAEISPEWSFDLRADAFRANHWRHWNDEGGPIYSSSTIVDVLGTLRWQPTAGYFVEAGYTFNYYTLDETGPEDGNHLLARQHGPVLAVGLSW